MIRWFLSLFPEYLRTVAWAESSNKVALDSHAEASKLREQVQLLSSEKLILQDRLDSVMNDRAELWRMMETAISNERATLQMQVNFATQQKFGITPFPDAVHLSPEASAPGQVSPLSRRQMPSEMIAAGTAKFLKEAQSRFAMKSGPVEAVQD